MDLEGMEMVAFAMMQGMCLYDDEAFLEVRMTTRDEVTQVDDFMHLLFRPDSSNEILHRRSQHRCATPLDHACFSWYGVGGWGT